MYSLYKDFTDENISLSYFGVFNDNITLLLIDLSEIFVSRTERLSKLTKKTSFLIAESFQNIIRHGIIEKDNVSEIQYNKDFFQITFLDDRIAISSANVIENKNVVLLNESIDRLNSLDSNELKTLYKHILVSSSLSDKGGAGLGLLEMVKKSGLPLQKHFISLKEGYSLFILSLELPINNDLKEHKVDISAVEKQYKKLAEEEILMLYKGDFSSTSNSNLVEMLIDNFLQESEISSDKAKNIVAIVEVMQNVSKHGKVINGYKEGIFSLREINQELFIECCNFVKQEDYNKLKDTLKTIKLSSKNEIKKMYKKQLANTYLSKDENDGLGLLEIARITKNTFTYSFVETPDNEIFFTIKIKTL